MSSTPSLTAFRRLAHAGLARAAFILETAAISACGLVLLTFLIVRSDPLATLHEWGSFLTHYVAATPCSRHPVNVVVLVAFALVFAFVASIRLPAARRRWAADGLLGLDQTSLFTSPSETSAYV